LILDGGADGVVEFWYRKDGKCEAHRCTARFIVWSAEDGRVRIVERDEEKAELRRRARQLPE
jgi:hypothetical protein